MKKIFSILITIYICVGLTSCTSTPVGNEPVSFSDTQDFITNLNTYACVATVTYYNNDITNSYKTLQYAKKSGEYRVCVLDDSGKTKHVITYDGENIYQLNPEISDEIVLKTSETQERSEIFVTSFISNYETSDQVSTTVSTIDESLYTVLEATIPNDHPYLKTEKLWLNNETYTPYKLVIYDYNKTPRIEVIYSDFVINPTLPNNVFVPNGVSIQ